MIIFTGTGRCGTRWLAECFGGYYEFMTKYFQLKRWFKFEKDYSKFEDRLEAMQYHLRMVKIHDFIDSNNLYVHFLDALYAIDNNVKIVLCIREKDSFIKSAINKDWHSDKYVGFHHVPVGGWNGMNDPYKRCEWIYNHRNNMALRRLASVPEKNKLIVRLEEITKDLSPVEKFLGMPADPFFIKKRVNGGRYK